MLDRLEDYPWYNGLYGEVVTTDCYGLKTIDYQPDIIFDIGGNVGVFSRYARILFPEAKIIAVEPNPINCGLFRKFTNDNNLILLEKAIGKGIAWKHGGAINGMHVYTTPGLGYPIEDMEAQTVGEGIDITGTMQKTSVETILPYELLKLYSKKGDKVLMKIDCEGGENSIWSDSSSLEEMRLVDYLVIETHYYSNSGGEVFNEMKEATTKALKSFEDTHTCIQTNVLFTAIKK